RVPSDRGRGEVEGVVGDAGVDVHAAVVVGGVDVVGHRGRLRVPAEHVVVVGGAGGAQRSQRLALDGGGEQPCPDQPVRLLGGLTGEPLLHQGAEDVGDALVERARLPAVDEPDGQLGDAVRQLVPDDVDGAGEAGEHLAV